MTCLLQTSLHGKAVKARAFYQATLVIYVFFFLCLALLVSLSTFIFSLTLFFNKAMTCLFLLLVLCLGVHVVFACHPVLVVAFDTTIVLLEGSPVLTHEMLTSKY